MIATAVGPLGSFAWWQLEALGNTGIALGYLTIFALVIVPTVRTGQVRTNPLATATAAIFLSGALGHGLDAVHLVAPLFDGDAATVPMASISSWWTAGWHAITALVAIYYLSLRHSYGRLLETAPMFDDLLEQQASATVAEARDAAMASAASLRRSENIYRSAFEDAMVGMCMVGLDGAFIRANPVFAAMLGRDAIALVGVPYRDVQHPDDVAVAAEAAGRVLKGEISGYRTAPAVSACRRGCRLRRARRFTGP